MATYIPGVQSYMPEMKTFTPDYKFLSSVLDTKTNRYNTNYKQLNDLYSKVVYADLSRTDTKDIRNQYVEDLAPKLEKISGMDLSLQQNVDAARGLFKPFYEDDLIVKDMVVTKSYQNDIQYANSLKNSTDEKRRKQYWDIGVKAMNYQMEDFINADPNKALSMANPTYIENADLYNTAMKLLEESGFADGVIQEMPDEKGRFIIRQKNGELIRGDALRYIQNSLVSDPKIRDAYYAEAFVKSRDEAAAGIQSGIYANIDEGQRGWAINTIREEEARLKEQQAKDSKALTDIQGSNASWEKFNSDVGVVEGSQNDASMKRQKTLEEIFNVKAEQTNNLLKTAQMPEDGSTTQELLNRAYSIYMGSNIEGDLANAAADFSKMGQELIYKGETAEYARQRDFEYFKMEEKIKQDNKIAIEELKASLENGGAEDPLAGTDVKVTYDDASTLEVINAGIPQINAKVANDFAQETRGQMINFIIEAAQATQPQNESNNMYEIQLGGKVYKLAPGDPTSTGGDTLYELLNKKNQDGSYTYAAEISEMYSTYSNLINVKPTADNPNPLTALYPSLTSDSEAYKKLKAATATINERRARVKNAKEKEYEHYVNSYDLATAGGITLDEDYNDVVLEAQKLGLKFDIFDRENKKLLSEQEFINKYIALAKAGKIKNANDSWRWDPADENYQGTYETGEMEQTYGRDPDGIISYSYKPVRKTGFHVPEATADAEKIYKAMKDLLYATQNDSYNMIADAGAGKNTQTSTFTSFNMANALRGKNAYGSASDVIQNPTYSVNIEPTTIRSDANAIMFTRDAMMQYNNTPLAATGVVLGKSQEETEFTSKDELGTRILEAWMEDMKAYSKNPKLPKEGRPQATLSYSPVYGPARGEKKYAAYTLENISEAWLKKKFPKTFATSNDDINTSNFDMYTNVSFVFDADQDVSVRKKGQYNYSEVMGSIANNPNHQYYDNVENGGNLRVTRDLSGQYKIGIQLQNYNSKTHNMETDPNVITANLSEWLQKNGLSDDNLDYGVNYYLQYLIDKSIANMNAQKADTKINKSK